MNWDVYMERLHPDAVQNDFEVFLDRLTEDYAEYNFAHAAAQAHVQVEQVEELAKMVADAGTRLATHTWRSAPRETWAAGRSPAACSSSTS